MYFPPFFVVDFVRPIFLEKDIGHAYLLIRRGGVYFPLRRTAAGVVFGT